MTNHKTTPCKACGAPVIWIKDQNGTKLPVNKVRVRAYIVTERRSCYLHLDDNEPRLVHVSHFTTCPGASEFSQGKKK